MPLPLGPVFRDTTAIRRGLLTKAQLRSSAWRHIRQDVYADAGLAGDHELSCRAARLRLPAGTLFAGPSAAYLYGVSHAATFEDEVHVITPTAVRLGRQRLPRVHHLDLSPPEIATHHDLPRTAPARTAWDLATWLDPLDSVPILDTLLNRHLVSPAELDTLASTSQYASRRGWRRAKQAFGLADPAAQSRPESVLRVRLVSAGLPRPVAQCPVQVEPRLLLHTDLGWPQWRVAVEYDGHWHANADQLHRDRRRLNQLIVAGWTVLHVTSRRLHNDFPAVLAEIQTALSAKGWHPTHN